MDVYLKASKVQKKNKRKNFFFRILEKLFGSDRAWKNGRIFLLLFCKYQLDEHVFNSLDSKNQFTWYFGILCQGADCNGWYGLFCKNSLTKA